MDGREKEYGFSIDISNICKGIAIIWMMYHHLVPYTEFTSGPVVGGIYLPGILGLTGKACVSIFLMLSGYGLYKSYGKYNNCIRFYFRRFQKIYLTYWLIFDIFTTIGIWFFRTAFIYLTETPFSRTKNLLYSLSGVQYFINNAGYMGYNPAWWYIGLCVALYALYPLFHRLLNKFPKVFITITLLIYFLCWNIDCKFILIVTLLHYIPAFFSGMFLAYSCFFEKTGVYIEKQRGGGKNLKWLFIILICANLGLILIKYIFRNQSTLGLKLDCIISFLIMGTVYIYYYEFEKNVCIKILKILGQYSFEIYLIHLFVTNMYTTMYIYGINDAFWMVIATLCISMIFAVMINKVSCIISKQKSLLNIVLLLALGLGVLLSMYGGSLQG